MASTLITAASMKRRLKRVAEAERERDRIRRTAIADIKAARLLSTPGQLRLVREDRCGGYEMARAMLASARGQIANVKVMNP